MQGRREGGKGGREEGWKGREKTCCACNGLFNHFFDVIYT